MTELSALTYGWIPARYRDGTIRDIGIREALDTADQIVDIVTPTRLERAAVVRLLAAADGLTLDPAKFLAATFMQHPDPPNAKQVGVSNMRLIDYSNSRTLYTTTPGDTLTLAEALLALITWQAFARGGKGAGHNTPKKSTPTWDALWLPIGETLTDTLRMLKGDDLPDDKPGWDLPAGEGEQPVKGWRHLYTYQSRQMKLELDAETCVGVRIAPGWYTKDVPPLLDPCVVHKRRAAGNVTPYRPGRQRLLEGLSVLGNARTQPGRQGDTIGPGCGKHAHDDTFLGIESVAVLVTQAATDHIIEDAITIPDIDNALTHIETIDVAENLLYRAQRVLAGVRTPALARQRKDGTRDGFYHQPDVQPLRHQFDQQIRDAIVAQTRPDDTIDLLKSAALRFVEDQIAQAHPSVWRTSADAFNSFRTHILHTPKPDPVATETENDQ